MKIVVQEDPSVDAVADFLGIDHDELAGRDEFQPPSGRWLAFDGQVPVGLATAFVRADDRLFVNHRVKVDASFEPLLHAALQRATQPLHLTVRHDEQQRLDVAERAGFTRDLEASRYDVPFGPALRHGAGYRSSRLEIMTADQVDPDQLFALDTELRQDIPGNDGWRGNRVWFDDEMASNEFDPTAYLVARDPQTGHLVGLCRFWNNQPQPSLGMLGVRRGYRTGLPALSLLYEAMQAASRWGSDTFEAHTARPSLQRRLQAIGARTTGGFTRLRHPSQVDEALDDLGFGRERGG
jgi:hypothetical protein